jgi:hypothetical protein
MELTRRFANRKRFDGFKSNEEKWNEAVAHLPEAHENSRNGFVSRIVAEIERLG